MWSRLRQRRQRRHSESGGTVFLTTGMNSVQAPAMVQVLELQRGAKPTRAAHRAVKSGGAERAENRETPASDGEA